MAKSYLLFKGIYSDKSLERLEMVKKMGREVLDPELIENISFWTSFKMDPCVEMVFDRFGGDWSNRNEILQKIVKSLHRGLIMLWKIEAGGIFNSPFSHIGEDIWTIKTADIRLRARAWLSYGKNELLRKRPFPLHKTPYYIMFNHTPLWVSHLAGMILYDSFFEFKKDKGRTARELSDLLFFVSQRLPNASKKDFDQSSFFNTWKHLRKKNLAIWSTVALGERKDLGFENE
jgi:hypothetical protein